MKILKYQLKGYTLVFNPLTEETEEMELLSNAKTTWSEENEERIKQIAHNGEYTIEDDGQPEPVAEPTTDDVLNVLLGVTV